MALTRVRLEDAEEAIGIASPLAALMIPPSRVLRRMSSVHARLPSPSFRGASGHRGPDESLAEVGDCPWSVRPFCGTALAITVIPSWTKDRRSRRVGRSESFAKAERRTKAALGRKVKDLRRSLTMSQTELAEAAGVRRALVSDIERSVANPTLESLSRIAKALGVEPADLLGTDS